jgi:hypothetical protein
VTKGRSKVSIVGLTNGFAMRRSDAQYFVSSSQTGRGDTSVTLHTSLPSDKCGEASTRGSSRWFTRNVMSTSFLEAY